MTDPLKDHKIVSEEEWVEACKALLKKEKEFTALRDQLSQQRRDLPWVAVNKEYVFEIMGNRLFQNFLLEEANY
jgi:predicted dithiol-disulfide oxidoreductase (DUF899 family)